MLKRIEGRIGEWNEFVEFRDDKSKIRFIAQKSKHNDTSVWYVYRCNFTRDIIETVDFSYHKELAVDKALKAAICELETK